MTCWLSDFLVGQVIQNQPHRRDTTGFCPESIAFSDIHDLPKPHHRQNSKSQFADDTALWAASKNVQFAAKRLVKDVQKMAKWHAK